MSNWKPHQHDARIASLMQTPEGETVEAQRQRCAEYGRLVAERGRDLGHDAYAMAINRETESHSYIVRWCDSVAWNGWRAVSLDTKTYDSAEPVAHAIEGENVARLTYWADAPLLWNVPCLSG